MSNIGDVVLDSTEAAHVIEHVRPTFPKRAVVTAGMPYGNKELHFGHIGGLFIHADVYARFLRDRLGAENVIFVSGTDCYGSAIETGYAEQVRSGMFQGTIEDFVRKNHARQKEILCRYGIEPDLYAASALDEAGRIHAELSVDIFGKLYDGGFLRFAGSKQFYDAKHEVYLNGRQVTGRCPIQGCKSETAYADECALGHQFSPEELLAPESTLSREKPELREINNWYFDLERFHSSIETYKQALSADVTTRKYLISVINEFLKPLSIYVKREAMDELNRMRATLPVFEFADDGKSSLELVFTTLEERKTAVEALNARGIRCRTGKTLVPFRITGNIAWGVPVPEREKITGLTFWCWPESLWAPVSFTKACLKMRGDGDEAYKDWWMSKDARVYQFIGEDNIYFYSVAQTGLLIALQSLKEKAEAPEDEQLRLTTVVPNRHVLYMKKKASSSGAAKPPRAEDLLGIYSCEQLRLHFFHMNLAENSVGFSPKALLEPEKKGEYDPVVYEGNLLTNIFNRLIRSCFYTLQKHFEGRLPLLPITPDVKAMADQLIVAIENAMYRFEFNRVFELLDQYLRQMNKRWAERSAAATCEKHWAQLLVDSFHVVRTALTFLHPLVPDGVERVREYLCVDMRIWDWTYIFEPITFFFEKGAAHDMKFLEPRVDFFEKPDVQYG